MTSWQTEIIPHDDSVVVAYARQPLKEVEVGAHLRDDNPNGLMASTTDSPKMWLVATLFRFLHNLSTERAALTYGVNPLHMALCSVRLRRIELGCCLRQPRHLLHLLLGHPGATAIQIDDLNAVLQIIALTFC